MPVRFSNLLTRLAFRILSSSARYLKPSSRWSIHPRPSSTPLLTPVLPYSKLRYAPPPHSTHFSPSAPSLPCTPALLSPHHTAPAHRCRRRAAVLLDARQVRMPQRFATGKGHHDSIPPGFSFMLSTDLQLTYQPPPPQTDSTSY